MFIVFIYIVVQFHITSKSFPSSISIELVIFIYNSLRKLELEDQKQ